MIQVHHGEASELPFPDDHFDGLFTDSPYGYGFMNLAFDKAVKGATVKGA